MHKNPCFALSLLKYLWYNDSVAESINSQPKKIVSVTFAIIFGIGIIFVAWRSSVQTSSPILSKTPGGVLGVLPSKYSYATLGFNSGRPGASDLATTSTDFIAEQLVLNYALAQRNTATTTFVNPDSKALAADLAQKALSDPNLKQYTTADLALTSDSSVAGYDVYRKKVAAAFRTLIDENQGKELVVIATAIDAKNEATLAPLASSQAAYEKFLAAILVIPVPPSAIKVHLLLVHSASLMASGIEDIRQMIADPVRGMRGMAKYNYGLSLLSQLRGASPK